MAVTLEFILKFSIVVFFSLTQSSDTDKVSEGIFVVV